MAGSVKIENAVRSLARVAIIEGRGRLREGEVIFYHLMDGVDEGAERAVLEGLDLNVAYYHEHDRSYVTFR
ncbi:hypothetical protein ACFL4K_03440, partial [Candidatus Neomarinimicrobiota bacterium]